MITQKNVSDWLQTHHLATLATTTIDGEPQLATVYTAVDKDFNCYFVTKEFTRKFGNLQNNKTMALSWFDDDDTTSCELLGEAKQVENGAEVILAITRLQEIMTKQKTAYFVPPVGQVEGSNYVVFKVTPRQVTYVDYSSTDQTNPQPKRLEFII